MKTMKHPNLEYAKYILFSTIINLILLYFAPEHFVSIYSIWEIRIKSHEAKTNAVTLQYHYTNFEIFSMETLTTPHGIIEHQMHITNSSNEQHPDP